VTGHRPAAPASHRQPADGLVDEPVDRPATRSHPGAVVTFAELAAYVRAAPPRLGLVRLVCVDGPTCSGKTTLAGRLAAALDTTAVVHLDDLYEGWDGLPGVGARLEEWVLAPLRAGRPGRYRRYDWHRGAYAEWHEVPVVPVLVVEGVGAAGRTTDPYATLRIWVEAPTPVRVARAEVRDQGAFGPYWDAWAAAERDHFAAEDTRARADLLVDGAPTDAYDPETGVVVAAWHRRAAGVGEPR
jgi:uridine kinase